MADRAITVEVRAVVSDYQRGMRAAKSDTQEFDRTVSGMVRNHKNEMTQLGVAAGAAGVAIAAGFTASAKAAIDWESAFAGVVKTVDATAVELAGLESGLRDMALAIPATHEELAGIAEAAGQLGIETDNILGFTRVMADLGVATNLTSEEAAVLFARFANITGLDQSMFENLGSAVVHLGNNMATTEREIGEMALRIAAAGSQIGLTEAEILGFAGALSSVGIEAQAGGTAISRVFIEIDKAVREGGSKLDAFAETAGMSADQFAEAYRTNAGGAIITFIEGLRGISDAGGNVFGVLEELSLQDIRVRDALLRAAGAGDKFRQALDESSAAFQENNALSEEAQRRYDTVASQLTIAGNAIKDMAISFGEILLPVLIPVIEGVRNLATWLSELPEPVKVALAVGAGLAGVLLSIGGAALILGPRILTLVDAYNKLKVAMAAAKAAQFVPGLAGMGAGALAAKAIPVVGAGVAVGMAVKEGVKLAGQIQSGQATLAQQLAQLMTAAQRGDEDAARRLNKFREQYVESKGFLADIGDRINFEGIRHQSQEIWKQAEALVASGEAARGATASTEAFLAANDPAASAMGKVAGSTHDAATAAERYRNALNAVEERQRSLNSLYANSVGSVGAVVQAVDQLRTAEANLKEVQKDSKATAEDVAAAQFDYVQALINTQVAVDALDMADVNRAVVLLSTQLGLSKEEAAELLELLGILDGSRFQVYVDIYEQVKKSTGKSAVGGASFIPELRAAGGPTYPDHLYQVGERNLPELYGTKGGLYMIPGDRGQVFSHQDSKALIAALSGGGGSRMVNYNVNLEGTGDPLIDSQLVGSTVSVLRRTEERVA